MSLFTATGETAAARRRGKIIAVPTRIEPKVFLANERTFLHHAHYALILAVLGIALLNSRSDSPTVRWASVGFVAISFGVLIRQLRVFLWRSQRIRRRDADEYMDARGPYLIVGGIAAVVLANVCVRLWG